MNAPGEQAAISLYSVKWLANRKCVDEFVICGAKLVRRERLNKGSLHAKLYYQDKASAADALVKFWEACLVGVSPWIPKLFNIEAWSQEEVAEVDDRVSVCFVAYMDNLHTCSTVDGVRKQVDEVREKVCGLSKVKNVKIAAWERLQEQKQEIGARMNLLQNLLLEFTLSIDALQGYVTKGTSWPTEWSKLFVNKERSWEQVYSILLRELERLSNGLPVYSQRSLILETVWENQVTVLVGETGSGKSTQLVQYLCDAGFSRGKRPIVCTQPRKVAAHALAGRVAEECRSCYEQERSVRTLRYRSEEELGEIVFTTDNVLLQLQLSDRNLDRFSCIVVDEVHERSLHTDLLLALLKQCLARRKDLKVIIMSATVEADVFCKYFGAKKPVYIPGRKYPVDMHYESVASIDNHVTIVVEKVQKVHSEAASGDILAFLSSQADVEWACSRLAHAPSALILPLHGKLRQEDQRRVFEASPVRKRKIVFTTNIAETSLTIPGIRYVVDPGWSKQVTFDPRTGISTLKLCRISQSSAAQRAGRAGRTSSGVCYRLYTKEEFDSMPAHGSPEISNAHLGVVMLKLMALGVQDVEKFDFIERPSTYAITHAVKCLQRLGAIEKQENWVPTDIGWQMAKLGADPRFSKIILDCAVQGYGREGLVLTALLSCSSTIFYRSGSDEDKLLADRRKMRFCHPHGDLFSLLNVYKEWSDLPGKHRAAWCMQNNINGKSLRTCQDQITDLEESLKYTLNIRVPASWSLSPERNVVLRRIVALAMMENLAVFSGNERLGYDVVSVGCQAYIHPASAVLVYGDNPEWLVYGQLLCTSREFLSGITVVEPEWVAEVAEKYGYDMDLLQRRKLYKAGIPCSGRTLMARVCGRQGLGLLSLEDLIQARVGGEIRCRVENAEHELHVFATLDVLETARTITLEVVEKHRKWVRNECIERQLGARATGILLEAGGQVKEIVMPGEYTSVEVFHAEPSKLVDEDLLGLFDSCGEGVARFQKSVAGKSSTRWGIVTFRSLASARAAVELGVDESDSERFSKGICLQITPVKKTMGSRASFPSVTATINWLRRKAKGFAFVECADNADIDHIISSCSGQTVCGSVISCKRSRTNTSVFITNISPQSSTEVVHRCLEALSSKKIEKTVVPHEADVSGPPVSQSQRHLREMFGQYVPMDKFQVIAFETKEKNIFNRVQLRFDEGVHEAVASALENVRGKTLPGCEPWQKLTCKAVFQSVVHCNVVIYKLLSSELSEEMQRQQMEGERLVLQVSGSDHVGNKRIELSSPSLASIARCRAALEKIIEGVPLEDKLVDEACMRLLFSREGYGMLKKIESKTQTVIFCDRRCNTVKVYGRAPKVSTAIKALVTELVQVKQRERKVPLRGNGLPGGLMKTLVQTFGVDLQRLEQQVGASVTMNHRQHMLYVHGDTEAVKEAQRVVWQLAESLNWNSLQNYSAVAGEHCPICLSPVDNEYKLEACGHSFCRECLINQLEFAIKNREGIPITCAAAGCGQMLLTADLTTLLTSQQIDELCRASLTVFVASAGSSYRFCPTPDCPSVYRISGGDSNSSLFVCSVCKGRLCTLCHVEFHDGLTCEAYQRYKQDPDASLAEWRQNKESYVKSCPACKSVIEKDGGCNHISCRCGTHVCWVCLEVFGDSSSCYSHISIHG